MGLDPGTYDVVANGQSQKVTVTVASTATLNFAGAASSTPGSTAAPNLDTVNVVAPTLLQEVRTSEVGKTVSLQQIQTTPQVSRNFLEFADAVPGMIFTRDAKGNTSLRGGATNADGTNAMIPLNTVVKAEWVSASPSLSRYNGYSAINIVGSQAPGTSSGEAMQTMEAIVNDDLPAGFGYDWSGMSYQEILAGNAATLLLVLSIVVVFLCLAALYESWSIPVAVLLVVPLGVLGALGLSMLRGLPNDLFFKIGLITVIGLAAKNAILIVEFAVEQRAAGKNLRDATIEAARLRFRPILMTSFAFIMGVIPMAISTGAGSGAKQAIGTGVLGGMIVGTVLGVFFVPLFFVVVQRVFKRKSTP
ncbi:hypothetical protein G6F50_013505 [Rhizopus delemar]|uniref:Hydrophobe/amphiphile efflux-1 (HAE1) family RND transporter n=1 Tax=Rhizopus delemar TaxID=936053 RepID=A0A9P7CDA3_9FUNG|nr:hypothetical protein G6F50_013505 [Rhizopus delemar]